MDSVSFFWQSWCVLISNCTLLFKLQEAYPRVEVTDIQIAYDVKSLMGLSLYKDSVAQARLTAEYHFRTTGERMIMAPYRGGYFFGCCCKTVRFVLILAGLYFRSKMFCNNCFRSTRWNFI